MKQGVGVLALLCSSAAFATATVTVVPSNATPSPGETFYVTVSGAGFPSTAGATLGLTFNSAVVTIPTPTLPNNIALAPGSPFTTGIVGAPNPFSSGDFFSILGPLIGPQPSGNFDAFRIYFTVSPTATPGSQANIALVDDGVDFGQRRTPSRLFQLPTPRPM